MSSLRLALKQSLEELEEATGGAPAPSRGKKKKDKGEWGQRPQQQQQQQHSHHEESPQSPRAGESHGHGAAAAAAAAAGGDHAAAAPRRKRGRPRKHPRPEDQQQQHAVTVAAAAAAVRGGGEGRHHHETHPHSHTISEAAPLAKQQHSHEHDSDDDAAEFSSENEFSIDIEEEEVDEEDTTERHEDDDEESSEDNHRGRRHPHERHSAANKIQNHWKKKKKKKPRKHHDDDDDDDDDEDDDTAAHYHGGGGSKASIASDSHNAGASLRSESPSNHSHSHHNDEDDDDDDAHGGKSSAASSAAHAASSETAVQQQQQQQQRSEQQPPTTTTTRKKKPKTVPQPDPELLAWQTWQLSTKKSRKYITAGLRVKVRFATQKHPNKKRKKKWFGGRVSAVSKEGSKIRIKYDDGTTEVTKYPDKDIVVDDTHNGQHQASAEKFLPPPPPQDEEPNERTMPVDDDELEEGEERAVQQQQQQHREKQQQQVDKDNDEEQRQSKATKSQQQPKEEEDKKKPAVDNVDQRPSSSSSSKAAADLESQKRHAEKEDTKSSLHQQRAEPDSQPKSTEPLASDAPMDAHHAKQPEHEALVVKKKQSDGGLKKEPPTHEQQQGVKTPAPKQHDSSAVVVPSEISVPSPSSEAAAAAPPVVVKVKRKRGRPPKHRPPVAAQPEHASTAATAAASSKAPVEGMETVGALGEQQQRRDQTSSVPQQPTEEGAQESSQEPPTAAAAAAAPQRPSLTIRIPLVKETALGNVPKNKPTRAASSESSQREDGEIEEEPETAALLESKLPSRSGEEKTSRKNKRTVDELGGADESTNQPPAPKRIHIRNPILDQAGGGGGGGKDTNNRSSGGGKDENKNRASSQKKAPSPGSPRQKKKKRKHVDAEGIAERMNELKAMPSVKIPKLDHATASSLATTTETTKNAQMDALPKGGDVHSQMMVSSEDAGAGPPVSTPRSRGNKQQQQLQLPDNAPIVRSGRRAAQQANERISSKQENVIPEQSGKGKKKKRKDGAGSDVGNNDGQHDKLEDAQWVQCDGCGKWRIIPNSVVKSLPKQWYCKDNLHDPKRASCEAPEQTAKQVAKERKRMKKRQQRLLMEAEAQTNKESGAGVDAAMQKIERTRSPRPRDAVLEDGGTTTAKQKRASPVDQLQSVGTGGDAPPKSEKKGSASGKKGRSSENKEGSTDGAPEVRRGRGRPRRNAGQNKESAASSDKGQAEDTDNLEWVQCEKCDKWRKLPPHISAVELPDVWYCSMNTWSENASCDAPEDKADGLQDVGIFGSSGSSNKLSYRNLIFGSTGRKANRPVSERARAAESLFGVATEDDDLPPAVMYANSSAFVSRSKAAAALAEEKNKSVSIFDVMNYSNLWTELRAHQPFVADHAAGFGGAAASVVGKPTSLAGYTFETLPPHMKQPVQDLVLEVLGKNTLTGDEVMIRAQGENYENVSETCLSARAYCTINVVVTALCHLVRQGTLECVHSKGTTWTVTDWNPRYRLVAKPLAAAVVDEAVQPPQPVVTSSAERMVSRCMKIAKPWKRMQS